MPRDTRQRALTALEKDRIRDLHARGMSMSGITRELGRGKGTIVRFCHDEGLTFDRTAMKAATAARKADAAQLRAELELQLLEDAQALRAQVWQPHEYINHGGKEFVEVRWTQDQPSPVDKLKLMQAAGIALDRSVKLASLDKDDEVEAAKSMLVSLFEQFDLVTANEAAKDSPISPEMSGS